MSETKSSTNDAKRQKTEGDARESRETDDVRVAGYRPLLPPACLVEDLPLSKETQAFIKESRRSVQAILEGTDDRLVIVVGPCSIHDVKAAKEYATSLKTLSDELAADLFIIMRTYFEKPRTTVGWKGLINDPFMDGSFRINKGLRIGRSLLLDISEIGLPVGAEFLDTISPQYTADLVSWGAIGARTTESQIHRELVSGLSMPVGFKNGTSGATQVAVDAMISSSNPHQFLGVTSHGLAAIVQTKGNEYCHVILRGGSEGTNYDKASVQAAAETMTKKSFPARIIIDCSHGNSLKLHTNQPIVAEAVGAQVAAGDTTIKGLMIESNIVAGNQKLGKDPSTLVYGQSITDACIDLDTTATVLRDLAASVRAGRATRQ